MIVGPFLGQRLQRRHLWCLHVEVGSVSDVCSDEAVLFFGIRVASGVDSPWSVCIVIVVAPLRKVVCEFQARRVCICIFKVDDDELLVSVGR